MSHEPDPTAWIIHSGAAGHRVQCDGIAQALGLKSDHIIIAPGRPHRWLAPWGPAWPDRRIAAPWPEIVIASGRQSVPYLRRITRASCGKAFTVFLQNPVVSTKHFDFVWAPEHDRLSGANVITTITSPHTLTQDRLNAAGAEFERKFDYLPRPFVGVLVGGQNAVFRFGRAEIDDLADRLITVAREAGVGLLVTSSRRTGADNTDRLVERLKDVPAYIWNGKGSNPYLAILSLANSLIVSCDSVNMIGEAAFTGKPVQMFRLPGGSEKFDRFHASMIRCGAARWFKGLPESWKCRPLNATETVAEAIREAFEAKTGKSLR